MLESLFGNKTLTNILFYLYKHQTANAYACAKELNTSLSMVQKQLVRLEKSGILRSYIEGKKRIYRWNPLWPFYRALKQFLDFKDIFLQEQKQDPLDGSHLTIEERIALGDNLYKQSLVLSPIKNYKPFIQSFDSFEDYEKWKTRQKHPWLVSS